MKGTVIISTYNGKDFNRKEYRIADVQYIQKSSEKDSHLMLFSEHDSLYYTINNKNKLKKHKSKAPITFYMNEKGLKIKSYNLDIEDNILEIKDQKYKNNYELILPSYLITANFDNEYIYVSYYYGEKDEHLLYVIDREQSKVIKTISLTDDANKIEPFGEVILINTDSRLLA